MMTCEKCGAPTIVNSVDVCPDCLRKELLNGELALCYAVVVLLLGVAILFCS